MTLVSPNDVEPELSVVMVTYGAWSLTEQAVAALAAIGSHRLSFLVIAAYLGSMLALEASRRRGRAA